MALEVTVESADALAPEWATLVPATDRPAPFQHPAWHAAWWEIFGGSTEQRYYAVREAGRLVAVAPMQRTSKGVLVFSGDPEIMDYMDLISEPGREEDALDALLATWKGESAAAVRFWGLREESPLLTALRARGVAFEEEAVAPRITLAPDWEAYLASLSKKDRHELRRKMRRLEGAGMAVGLRVIDGADEVDGGLEPFFNLHKISRADKAEFMTPIMERFFRRISHDFAALGTLRLFLIDLDDKPAAALIAFQGEDLAVWNSGYDPEYSSLSIGLYSKAKAIEWAIGQGLPRVDFLRGREPYKYDLGGVDLVVWRGEIPLA